MSISLLLAFVGLIMITVNDIIYGHFSSKADMGSVLSFYIISSAVSFIFVFIVFECRAIGSISAFTLPSTKELLYGSILGIFASFGYILYFLSFSNTENISSSVTIFRLNLVPSVILSILFLGEQPTVPVCIAIGIGVLAILLMREKGGSKIQNKNILMALGACFAAACLNVLNKSVMSGGDVSSIGLFLVRSAFVAVFSVLFFLIAKKKFCPTKRMVKLALFSGILISSEVIIVMEALKDGLVSVIIPITQLSFVFVTIYSAVFSNQRLPFRKIAAVIAAVIAILIISM